MYKTSTTSAGTNAAAPKTKEEGEQIAKRSKNRTFLALILVVLFVIVIRSVLSSSSASGDKKGNDGKEKGGKEKASYTYKKKVKFTANYSDTTLIPSGFMVSIIDASGPYCISNGDGSEEDCSIETEDISDSDKFTDTNPQNKFLRFKSQNGTNDSCVILLRSKL